MIKYEVRKTNSRWGKFTRRVWLVWVAATQKHVLVLGLEDIDKWEAPTTRLGWSNFDNNSIRKLVHAAIDDMADQEQLDRDQEQLDREIGEITK